MWGEFILACVFLFYWWLLDIVWAICFGEWLTALPYLISFCVKRTDISLESFFPLVGSMFCVWLWKYWFLCCETRNRLALLREFGFSWGYVLRVLIYIYILAFYVGKRRLSVGEYLIFPSDCLWKHWYLCMLWNKKLVSVA